MSFVRIGALDELPVRGARVVETAAGRVAVFRNADDEVFAVEDRCPHQGGPLSQGIVHGRTVTCPLHGWRVGLDDGCAVAPDEGCVATRPVRVEGGVVYLDVGPPALVDAAE